MFSDVKTTDINTVYRRKLNKADATTLSIEDESCTESLEPVNLHQCV